MQKRSAREMEFTGARTIAKSRSKFQGPNFKNKNTSQKSRCHAGANPHHPRPKQPAKKGGETNYHEISRNHRTRRNGAEPRRMRLEAGTGNVAFIRIDRLFQVSPRLRGVSVFKARPSPRGRSGLLLSGSRTRCHAAESATENARPSRCRCAYRRPRRRMKTRALFRAKIASVIAPVHAKRDGEPAGAGAKRFQIFDFRFQIWAASSRHRLDAAHGLDRAAEHPASEVGSPQQKLSLRRVGPGRGAR